VYVRLCRVGLDVGVEDDDTSGLLPGLPPLLVYRTLGPPPCFWRISSWYRSSSSDKISYAAEILANSDWARTRSSSHFCLSGWFRSASFRYAFFTSVADAFFATPKISYGSSLSFMAVRVDRLDRTGVVAGVRDLGAGTTKRKKRESEKAAYSRC